jgi:hypothetical protein
MYITFDPYYNVTMYNSFVATAKKKGIPIKEYIEVRTPYNWYIQIEEKYLPVFLDYKVASKETENYLLEKLIPLFSNEAYTLTRKLSTLPQSFETFVSPDIFQKIPTASYAVCFRYKNKETLMRYSKELGLKIYLLGRHRDWNLAFCFNKYIRNYVFTSDVLLEKNKASEFQKPCDFERMLNYKKLVKAKLNNKTMEYPYIDDGVYYPLKKLVN